MVCVHVRSKAAWVSLRDSELVLGTREAWNCPRGDAIVLGCLRWPHRSERPTVELALPGCEHRGASALVCHGLVVPHLL
jgi:hypothetical protein